MWLNARRDPDTGSMINLGSGQVIPTNSPMWHPTWYIPNALPDKACLRYKISPPGVGNEGGWIGLCNYPNKFICEMF